MNMCALKWCDILHLTTILNVNFNDSGTGHSPHLQMDTFQVLVVGPQISSP